jgi:hypothetical protein
MSEKETLQRDLQHSTSPSNWAPSTRCLDRLHAPTTCLRLRLRRHASNGADHGISGLVEPPRSAAAFRANRPPPEAASCQNSEAQKGPQSPVLRRRALAAEYCVGSWLVVFLATTHRLNCGIDIYREKGLPATSHLFLYGAHIALLSALPRVPAAELRLGFSFSFLGSHGPSICKPVGCWVTVAGASHFTRPRVFRLICEVDARPESFLATGISEWHLAHLTTMYGV